MLILFVFVYLVGIVALSVVGNGVFSFITIKKPIKLSTLETLVISIGLGIIFIILYGYVVDFIVDSFGLIINTQFLIMVIIPVGIGTALKLFCTKKKIGKDDPLIPELNRQFKNAWQKIRDIVPSLKAKLGNGKDRRNNIIKTIVVFFIFFLLLLRIYGTIATSAAQFSQDPFIWMNVIINYANGLKIDYSVVMSNPAGTYIYDAYFLQFLLFLPYSWQYYFLKWLPFLNLFLLYFVLYVIQKRLFKNPIYFIALFLLSLTRYFFYRFTMLLPSSLVIIILEFIILLALIPELPRFLTYLFLGTSLTIHAINGVLLCAFYFAYKLLVGLTQLYRTLKTRQQEEEKRVHIKIRKLAKVIVWNLMVFCIPVAFFILSLTIRFSPDWWYNYYWYLRSPEPLTSNNFSGNYTTNISSIFAPLSADLITEWTSFLSGIGWIFSWGNPFLIFTLIFIFIPQKWYVDTKEKKGLVTFAKLSLLLSFIAFLLPKIGILLDALAIIPGGSSIAYILASPIYSTTSERLFEVTNIFNVVLLGLVFENFIRKLAMRSRNSPQNNSTENRYVKTFILILFIGNLFIFIPYYEYTYNSRTTEGLLYLRDYLDLQTPGEKIIGYNREDSKLPVLVDSILSRGNNYTQIWYDITVEGINLNFTNNPNNDFDFLVISLFGVNSTNANEIREAFFESSLVLYHNDDTLVLKFS